MHTWPKSKLVKSSLMACHTSIPSLKYWNMFSSILWVNYVSSKFNIPQGGNKEHFPMLPERDAKHLWASVGSSSERAQMFQWFYRS